MVALGDEPSPRPVLWPDTLMWSLEKSPREIGAWVGVLQDGYCVLPLWVTVLRAKQLPYRGVQLVLLPKRIIPARPVDHDPPSLFGTVE